MLWRILALSIAHAVVSFLTALATYGLDMDQLRSRSAFSRAAGVINDALWFPHDLIIRTVPRGWLVSSPDVVVPTAIIVNSLIWGVLLYIIWRGAQELRDRRKHPGSPNKF